MPSHLISSHSTDANDFGNPGAMTPAIPTRALLTPSGRPSTITPPPCSSSLLPSLLYASSPLTPLSAPRAPVAPYTLPSPPPLCRPPHDTTSRSAPCAGRDHATAPAPTTAAAAVGLRALPEALAGGRCPAYPSTLPRRGRPSRAIPTSPPPPAASHPPPRVRSSSQICPPLLPGLLAVFL